MAPPGSFPRARLSERSVLFQSTPPRGQRGGRSRGFGGASSEMAKGSARASLGTDVRSAASSEPPSVPKWGGRAEDLTKVRCGDSIEPQIRRDYPLNLSISISGGEETNQDSPSSGE